MSTGILTAADYAFFDFVSSFGKHYATKAEFEFRQALFKENYEFVEKWNSDLTHSHTLGINEFSDWTKDETKRLTGSRVDATRQREKATFKDTSSIPSTWSWVDEGMVTEVKSQGKCGSCWAFAITASVESAMAISGKGKLQNFSEQQLLDCTADAGNSCKGGWIDPTFDYIEAHPQMTYAEYPYVGVQQSTCAYEQSQGVGKVGSFKQVAKDESQFRAAVHTSPVVICIDAEDTVFRSYKSGVITQGCGTDVNHCITVVGYGNEGGDNYALVKNSWGAAWGDNGYLKIGTSNNQCGILNHATLPSE